MDCFQLCMRSLVVKLVMYLPADFKGRAGHVYQLKFALSDGTQYESTPEQLQPVTPIGQVRAQLNSVSLTGTERLNNSYTATHDFYVDFTDPADQSNYYRWEWVDWKRQEWYRRCNRALYQIKDNQGNLIEDCIKADLNASYPNYDDQSQATSSVAGSQPALPVGNRYNVVRKNEPEGWRD